jgi:hypothetical protein
MEIERKGITISKDLKKCFTVDLTCATQTTAG